VLRSTIGIAAVQTAIEYEYRFTEYRFAEYEYDEIRRVGTNDHVDRAPANTASISKRTVGGFGPTFCSVPKCIVLPIRRDLTLPAHQR
jgi:hypothetical protein